MTGQRERDLLPRETFAELGGLVAANADEPLTEVWRGPGDLECAILAGPMGGMHGYVRLPEPFRDGRKITADEDIPFDRIEVHGGLTWGMDDGGWVGFDTGHAWDVWGDPDVPESDSEKALRAAGLRPLHAIAYGNPEWMVVWTREKLRDEVDNLAAQLALWCRENPDVRGEKTPGERLAETRERMRTFSRVRAEGRSDAEALKAAFDVDLPDFDIPGGLPTDADASSGD